MFLTKEILIAGEDLSQNPFYPVAGNGSADLFPRHNPDSRPLLIPSFYIVDTDIPSSDRPPVFIDVLKVRVLAKSQLFS